MYALRESISVTSMTPNELELLIRERLSSENLLSFLNSERSHFRYLGSNRFSVELIVRDAGKLVEARQVTASLAKDLQVKEDLDIDWTVRAL